MSVRRVVGVAVGVLLLPGLPSQAGPTPTTRVVSVSYAFPAGETTGSDAWLFGNPTVTEVAQAGEDRVVVGALDNGGPVALAVDVTRNGTTKRAVVCQPLTVAVSKGTLIEATPLTGRCSDGTLSTPTGGHVSLVFHKRRTAAAAKAATAKPAAAKPTAAVRSSAPPEMRWAVLVGINDYAGRTHSTVGARGDVAVIRAALLKAGWRNDHILVVQDGQATAESIRWAFGWLAQRSTPRTFSLFHFSGHVCIASRGPCRSGHAYLWAHDNRFIPETEVRSRMTRVKGYSWLDVAACEAGAFDLHSDSRLFTASSQAHETSYEDANWRQSIWTGLVWDRGFSRGKADDKHKAHRSTIGEMVHYGRLKAPTLTKSASRGPQHPVVRGGRASWTLYAPPGG